MPVRVSIIIPTYNRADLVCDAIRSALRQIHDAFEVVVVDDGSTDGTAEAVAALGASVRYIRQPNAGVEEARNTGAQQALGAYLHFLDSDDVLDDPRAVATLTALLDEQPAVGFAYAQAREVDDDGQLLREYKPPFARPSGVWEGTRELEHLLVRNYIHPGAITLRRTAWDAAGGFDVACGGVFEDWDLWARVACRSMVAYAPTSLLRVRGQPEGLSKRFSPSNYLRIKRRVIDMSLNDAVAGPPLAPHRARIEASYAFDAAWLAYAEYDVANARTFLKEAQRLYPQLLGDPELPEARALWLKLKLPRALTDAARALKHRRSDPA